MKEKEIVIYTNSECNTCKEIKSTLKKEKIKFIEKEVTEWKEDWDTIQSTTYLASLPTILFKDTYFVSDRDFKNPAQVVQILNNYENPSLNNNNNIMLERMKTLNYNINFALNALDGLLRNIENKLTVLTTRNQEDGDKSTS